jgi:3-oxosteroid 1-dehydrogenase
MWDKEVDVLCVGSGGGGFATAIKAADLGARVLLVEKDSKVGGVTALSSGQIWVGANHLEPGAGLSDSEEETGQYLAHLSQGFADPAMQSLFIQGSIEVIRYLCDEVGIQMRVIPDLPDYYYPAVQGSKPQGRFLETEPFPAKTLGDWAQRCFVSPYSPFHAYTMSAEWTALQTGKDTALMDHITGHMARDERCVGAGIACWLLQAALARDVEVWTDSPAVKLVRDESGEGVAGAIIRTPQGELRVRARKGVMLATSGYDWNPAFVKAFEALPVAGTMCPPTVEGDHLVMAADFGAIPMPSRAPAQTPIFIGYHIPTERIYGKPTYRLLLPGRPHSIVVNRAGQRFANDSFYPDVATKVSRFDGQEQGMPNWPAWLVVDEDFRCKYGLSPTMPGEPFPEGMAVSADTLEELAARTGIDAAGLSATVARFNGFCASGVDPDFARGTVPWGVIMTGDARVKPNPTMAPLARGPFHAIPLSRVVMGVPTSGLQIDANAQVLNARGQPVQGLYAAGNSATWSDIGGGYNSGISNTRGLLYGYLAAQAMMAAPAPAATPGSTPASAPEKA